MAKTRFEELLETLQSLDPKLAKLMVYATALEFAILYHCSGEKVPEDIAEIIPQYAKYLNGIGCCSSPDSDDVINIISEDIANRKH